MFANCNWTENAAFGRLQTYTQFIYNIEEFNYILYMEFKFGGQQYGLQLTKSNLQTI